MAKMKKRVGESKANVEESKCDAREHKAHIIALLEALSAHVYGEDTKLSSAHTNAAWQAAQLDDVDSLHLLLQSGIVNANCLSSTLSDWTLIHECCRYSSPNCLTLLLVSGAAARRAALDDGSAIRLTPMDVAQQFSPSCVGILQRHYDSFKKSKNNGSSSDGRVDDSIRQSKSSIECTSPIASSSTAEDDHDENDDDENDDNLALKRILMLCSSSTDACQFECEIAKVRQVTLRYGFALCAWRASVRGLALRGERDDDAAASSAAAAAAAKPVDWIDDDGACQEHPRRDAPAARCDALLWLVDVDEPHAELATMFMSAALGDALAADVDARYGGFLPLGAAVMCDVSTIDWEAECMSDLNRRTRYILFARARHDAAMSATISALHLIDEHNRRAAAERRTDDVIATLGVRAMFSMLQSTAGLPRRTDGQHVFGADYIGVWLRQLEPKAAVVRGVVAWVQRRYAHRRRPQLVSSNKAMRARSAFDTRAAMLRLMARVYAPATTDKMLLSLLKLMLPEPVAAVTCRRDFGELEILAASLWCTAQEGVPCSQLLDAFGRDVLDPSVSDAPAGELRLSAVLAYTLQRLGTLILARALASSYLQTGQLARRALRSRLAAFHVFVTYVQRGKLIAWRHIPHELLVPAADNNDDDDDDDNDNDDDSSSSSSSSSSLGQGASGSIERMTLHADGYAPSTVAVKRFVDLAGSKATRDLLTELALLSLCESPHVVRFHGAHVDPANMSNSFAVLEAADMDLRCFVRSQRRRRGFSDKPPLTDKIMLAMANDVARGLAFLHSLQIIHRDLKAANVLVFLDGTAAAASDGDTTSTRRPLLKLCDFGCAREAMSRQVEMTRGVGTLITMAPEILRGGSGAEPCDIYALAIVFAELATLESPFANVPPAGLAHHVLQGNRPSLSDARMPAAFKQLIKSMWHNSPKRRPTVDVIVSLISDMMQK
jgi:Protein kinase domain